MASNALGTLLGQSIYNKEQEKLANAPSAYSFHNKMTEDMATLNQQIWSTDTAAEDATSPFEKWLMDNFWTAEAERVEAENVRNWQEEQNETAMNFEAEQAAAQMLFQQTSADKAMSFEAEEARKLREWQELQNKNAMSFEAEQSATAYQRAVKDLQAAGLNPILAALRGGSSTASGVTSSGASANGMSASGAMATGKTTTGAKANIKSNVGDIAALLGSVGNVVTSAAKLFI